MSNNIVPTKEQNFPVAGAESTQNIWFTPRVDILESENELTLFVDMPGVYPNQVDVRFENGELVLHGRCQPRHQSARFTTWEYGVGDFYRSFTISDEIKADGISAELKGGVLTVHLPKTEAVKPRRIPVKGE
jgi:HSP20 family protein